MLWLLSLKAMGEGRRAYEVSYFSVFYFFPFFFSTFEKETVSQFLLRCNYRLMEKKKMLKEKKKGTLIRSMDIIYSLFEIKPTVYL